MNSWNQWSFDQSDCHSNSVDNLIDTVGECVESDVSSGEIRWMFHGGSEECHHSCLILIDKQAWMHKQQTYTCPIHFFSIYIYIFFISVTVFFLLRYNISIFDYLLSTG